MRRIRHLIAILVIGINIYPCIPDTIKIFKTGGGPFGFGIMLIPILLIIHLSLISAVLTFTKKYNRKNGLIVFNVIGLLVGFFYIYMWLTIDSKPIAKINKNRFDLNSSLIIDFHRDDRLNPNNPDFQFNTIASFHIDLNNNEKADTIYLKRLKGWENDPGDFHQIQIKTDNSLAWTETNFDGWVRFDNNYHIPDSVKRLNQLDTDLLLITDFEDTKILCLFGWVYASESGLLTIIDFSSDQPRIMINKNLDLVGIDNKKITFQQSNEKYWIETLNNRILMICE